MNFWPKPNFMSLSNIRINHFCSSADIEVNIAISSASTPPVKIGFQFNNPHNNLDVNKFYYHTLHNKLHLYTHIGDYSNMFQLFLIPIFREYWYTKYIYIHMYMELQCNTSFNKPFVPSDILETHVKGSTIRVR